MKDRTYKEVAALLKRPGKHRVARNLYLRVEDSGAASWRFRYMVAGRPREMGLGHYDARSLAEVKAIAADLLARVHRGEDPLAERWRTKQVPTFKELAGEIISSKTAEWRNSKHADQWANTLATYAYPVIGHMRVSGIRTEHVLEVLRPIWTSKTETAKRVRGRVEAVLAAAIARRWLPEPNPARWKGHLDTLLARPEKVARVEHHPAVPWREMPAFMAVLRDKEGTSARALEFVVLTAARTSEVLLATWSEIDFESATWTVPAERMKAGKEHRVPLSDAAIALLKALPKREANEYIFPGAKKDKPLSNMALVTVMRRMQVDAVPHGFRSSFRDWCSEATSFPHEVAEMALAHVIANKTEAAYRRGDLFDRRREMMAEWAAYLSGGRDAT